VALRARETEMDRIARDLAQLDRAGEVRTPAAVDRVLEEAVGEWRAVLRRQAVLARQLVRKLVVGRLVVTPETRHEQPGYRVKGRGTVEPLVSVLLRTPGVPGRDTTACAPGSANSFDNGGVVHKVWRPQRDSNPCFGLERATS
jgi:hypothetical protein